MTHSWRRLLIFTARPTTCTPSARNGRTQRAFLTQLIRSAGYDLNWSEVYGDLLMIATIQAAQGVTDLLRQVLGEAIK